MKAIWKEDIRLLKERGMKAEGGPKTGAIRQDVFLMCSRKRRETSLGRQEIRGTTRKVKVLRSSRDF